VAMLYDSASVPARDRLFHRPVPSLLAPLLPFLSSGGLRIWAGPRS
jgi:hypothetical protein